MSMVNTSRMSCRYYSAVLLEHEMPALAVQPKYGRMSASVTAWLCVIQKEGVRDLRPLIGSEYIDDSLKQTLLCFVLMAPDSAHSFCSRYDFGPWPLLPGVTSMPPPAQQVTCCTCIADFVKH